MYFILVGTPILAFLSDGCALGNNAKTDGLNTFLYYSLCSIRLSLIVLNVS